MAKSDREIMEILEAFDLTRCAWSAAQLVGCDPKTVAAYVARRDAGVNPFSRLRRPRLVDPFLAKVEELVDHSQARSAPMSSTSAWWRWGLVGGAHHPPSRRRGQAGVAGWAGRRYRPWVPEPGMWLQFDWAVAPGSAGVPPACSAPGWPGRAIGW